MEHSCPRQRKRYCCTSVLQIEFCPVSPLVIFARFKQVFPSDLEADSFSYCLTQKANTPISSGIGSGEARDAICLHILATRGDGNK